MCKLKAWLELIGLGGLLAVGSVVGVALLISLWLAAIAGPVILVIWVVHKLFF